MSIVPTRSSRRRAGRTLALACLAMFVTGPVQAQSSSTPTALGGTTWRLVEFQSMDDKVTRPDDPAKYTMRLNPDGSVAMRLNCNRAMGKWTAEASSDASSGRFAFGPLAGTRALCPPPSMDEMIVKQAAYVRSYVLRDGKLHLSLMADGGIFVWEPVTDHEFDTTPDAAIEAALAKAFPTYTRDAVAAGGPAAQARYLYNMVDLNGDGQAEVLAYVTGRDMCGTGGCTLLVLARDTAGYRVVSRFPVSRLPVTVLPHRTGGWQDIVRHESGGGAPATNVTHVYDGKGYVERGRTPAANTATGTRYLTGALTPQTGAPLTPASAEAAAANLPKAPPPSKTGFATVCGVTVGGKDYRYRCTVEGAAPGASGQTVLHFPDNTVTLTWKSATSASATFAGMNPQPVTVSTADGITKFPFEDKVYFFASDRRVAAEQLETIR